VPHVAGARRQIVAFLFSDAVGVEKAQLDARRVTGKQREIDAVLGPRGSEWTGNTGRNALH
jgi:hypothetical protein